MFSWTDADWEAYHEDQQKLKARQPMTDNERLAKLLGWKPTSYQWQGNHHWWRGDEFVLVLPDYFNDKNTRDELLAAIQTPDQWHKIWDVLCEGDTDKMDALDAEEVAWSVIHIKHHRLSAAVLKVLEENQ